MLRRPPTRLEPKLPPKKTMAARPGIPLLTERGFAAPMIIAAHALTGRVPSKGQYISIFLEIQLQSVQ